MTIDRKHSIGIFCDHISAVIETKHPRDVSILLGTIQDLGFIDLFGKMIPDQCITFDTDTDVHLGIAHGHTMGIGPLVEPSTAGSADGKDDFIRSIFLGLTMGYRLNRFFGWIDIRYRCIRNDGYTLGQGIDKVHHGIEVGIRSQVFQYGLLHMQIILKTLLLQIIIWVVPFFGRTIMHQDLISLFDIIQKRIIIIKLG